ncbi:magnesium and cobalt transport protein CorA [Bacillus sp. V3-13]|uniref:magnesium/cobalt transporter CorA n=1 Tax=Bacillus sp. V3-13 TaxID=2053728 RepID=UPI000C77E032|nr:magnesium/cobalt transporter CorA [Bacillus sp. V3-13]PLR76248.1 magnesium and cobalt transport protein CorA [Bacillus sp. V3-13]
MIKTCAITHSHKLVSDITIEELISNNYLWYWIDYSEPTAEEIHSLHDPLHFHPLAIEDCTVRLQRPKLDYYEEQVFFVTHSVNPDTFEKEEVNMFLGEHYIVTFHQHKSNEIEEVWNRLHESSKLEQWDQNLVLYHVIDKLVDNYFPIIYKIEDTLNEIEDNSADKSIEELLEGLFETRHDLLAFRHTVSPMKDLLYRMLNSHRLTNLQHRKEYFTDIHDHLLKLSEMIDTNREITMDIRDSYLSLNANQTNRVMKVLTVITTIFMPLTFIAGVYGMNFENMPELTWKYGYFATLFVMFVVGIGMAIWFKKKGWFK